MAHWSDKYVDGRPYVSGQFDCADLAKLVQKEIFGREVELPADRDYIGKTGGDKARAMAAQVAREKDQYAVKTDSPVDGDPVLLIGRGQGSHIGVLCLIGCERYVLHATSSYNQPVRTLLRNLVQHGLAVEGFYKWL